MNKTVEQVLQTIAADIDSKWVSKLNFVEFAINSSVNAFTTKSPFELIYGKQIFSAIDQLDGLYRIKGAQQLISDIAKLVVEVKSKMIDVQLQQSK